MMRTTLALLAATSSVALPAPLELTENDTTSDVLEAAAELWTLHLDSAPAGRQLQEAAQPSKPHVFSVWSTARSFFMSREHIKAKLNPGTQPATSMPREFGLGYKHMLDWYCAKADNTAKKLCQRSKAPATSSSFLSKPEVADSVAAVKAYCLDPTNNGKALCTMTKMGKGPGKGAGKAVGTPLASTAAAVGASPAGAKKSGAKKAAKAAAKAAAKTT